MALISNIERILNDTESIRIVRYVVGGLLAFTVIVLCFFFVVIRAVTEKPKYITPRVIASETKYEPTPWYPDKKITKEVIEKASYEVLD